MSDIKQLNTASVVGRRKKYAMKAFPWLLACISTAVALNYSSTSYRETVIGSRDFTVTSLSETFEGKTILDPKASKGLTASLKDSEGSLSFVSIMPNQKCSIDFKTSQGKIIRITEKKVEMSRIIGRSEIIMRAEGETLSALACSSSQGVTAI
jgi:hypothetical protein